MSNNKKYILSAIVANKKLHRMALEIIERNYDEPQLILVGIKKNGSVIAKIISHYLKEIFKGEIIFIELEIDKNEPKSITLNPLCDFNNKTIILIDDVANSGKTMLYALKPLLDMHPKKIHTLALVERTHKIFPIHMDYVGISVSTTLDEHIFVEVENEHILGAWMEDEVG